MKKRKLYHGTDFRNLGSIMHEGIRKSAFEGGVYLTDSADSARNWTAIRVHAMGGTQVLVCEVEVEEHKLELGCDHSPVFQELFNCGESYLYKDKIKPKKIKKYIVYGKKETSDTPV